MNAEVLHVWTEVHVQTASMNSSAPAALVLLEYAVNEVFFYQTFIYKTKCVKNHA